jgi:hypothetical protein
LSTALALAAILQASVYELFPGEYQKIESAVSRRVQRLQARLTTESPDRRTACKLARLKGIMSADTNPS